MAARVALPHLRRNSVQMARLEGALGAMTQAVYDRPRRSTC
jgi:hypothetical protein